MTKRPITPEQLLLPAPDPGVVELAEKYLAPGSRVLDAGSGNGRNALYLARRGHSIIGIENDGSQILRARQLARTMGAGALYLSFQEGDICNPLFASESFDAVFVTRVLQELHDRHAARQALGEMQRITKEGGYNFVTAYIGTAEERATKNHLAILEPGEAAHIYAEHGWRIECTNQQVRPITAYGDELIINSHDEIVARKIEANSNNTQQLDITEYLRRVDPEAADALRGI